MITINVLSIRCSIQLRRDGHCLIYSRLMNTARKKKGNHEPFHITIKDVINCQKTMEKMNHPYQSLFKHSQFYTIPLKKEAKEKDRYCIECGQRLQSAASFMTLSKSSKRHQGLCVGCKRLFGIFLSDPSAKTIIKSRLLLPEKKKLGTVVSKSGIRKFDMLQYLALENIIRVRNEIFLDRESHLVMTEALIRNMKQRHMKQNRSQSQPENFPTSKELYDLMRQSDSTCAVSGTLGLWIKGTHWHPFKLTIDHIIPVSKGGCYDINNLQVMPYSLNQVKSNESDDELRRWLENFRSSVRLEKLVFY